MFEELFISERSQCGHLHSVQPSGKFKQRTRFLNGQMNVYALRVFPNASLSVIPRVGHANASGIAKSE